jgi:hypothetical protein
MARGDKVNKSKPTSPESAAKLAKKKGIVGVPLPAPLAKPGSKAVRVEEVPPAKPMSKAQAAVARPAKKPAK